MKNILSSILLVEDEPKVQFELKRFLQRYCSEVITANNGEEGLKLFKIHAPDIVVSDIKMPKMNGIDMAKNIKKLSPTQMIVFTTAHNDNSYFLEAIEMQVDGYILKPVDLVLLKKKMSDLEKLIVLQKEKKLYETILDDIVQMQDTMLAVYDENKSPMFYNKKLLSFLDHITILDFLEEYKSLDKMFEIKDDCYYHIDASTRHWIDEIKDIEVDKRIISIKDTKLSESKLFLVSLSDKTHNNHIIVTFSEITSIVAERRHYKHNAYTDELTQIDNRAKFNIIFDKAIEKFKSDKSTLSIVLMDIDNFKQVNDNYGHIMGDNILKMFTKLILDHIRVEDSFSRWGGEEFVLLLHDTNLESAKNITEKLRLLIENYNFGMKEKLTCSFGISVGHTKDTSKSLFKRADEALYTAKDSGRNRVVSKS